MNCEDLKDLYELHVLGLADPEEHEEIAAHLDRGCEICRRGVKQALAMNSLLLGSVGDARPPRRLKRRILASIGAAPRSFAWAGVLAAACMLAIAVWLGAQERQRAAELAQTRRALIEAASERDHLAECLHLLDQPDTLRVGFGRGPAMPPRGNVFVNGRAGVLLVASNLPALSRGWMYEMWLIPKTGAPHAAGMFGPGASGVGVHMMGGPVDVSSLERIAVTMEPESGSMAPTSKPIFEVPLAGI